MSNPKSAEPTEVKVGDRGSLVGSKEGNVPSKSVTLPNGDDPPARAGKGSRKHDDHPGSD
jgi:hypothetical protein